MNENEIVGVGQNTSTLTTNQCLELFTDLSTIFESLSDCDLDSIYRVVYGRWSYHSTRQNLIDMIKLRQGKAMVC